MKRSEQGRSGKRLEKARKGRERAAEVKQRSRATSQSGSSQRPTVEQLRCFAITAPGLEPITAAELADLGISGAAEVGGVSWTGSVSTLAMANLWLRTASRVVVRAAEFKARTFRELERHARQIPWERFVAAGAPVALRVTCKKSKLYHSGAVEQRLLASIEHRLGVAPVSVATGLDGDEADTDDAPTPTAQLFVVRVAHDAVTVSADSSGELLHRRGYRLATAKAPLRETLAAALLLASGWRGETPLVDPMCGAGTIPIEAALMARRIPPGLSRFFAFLRWPDADRAAWDLLVAHASAEQLARSPVSIAGSDRDEGAITAARANAERAGVAGDIGWKAQAVSALECPSAAEGKPTRGLIATNPPYGVRVGEKKELRDLYARLGAVVREQCPGWGLAMVSADRQLERSTGLAFEDRAGTRNGGIAVQLVLHTPATSSPKESR